MSSKRKHRSEDEEEDHDVEEGGRNSEDEEEEHDSGDEDYERQSPKKKRKTATKKKGGAANKKKKTGSDEDDGEAAQPKKKGKGKAKGKKKAAEEEEEEEDDSLFGMVKNRVATTVIVAEWISRYQNNATEAMRELLNFIIKACGYPHEVSKAKYAKRDIGEILAGIVRDTQYKAEGGQYPIVGRGKLARFKNNFLEFWDKLINKTQFTIIYDEAFLGALATIALVISSSQLRPFRHTGTLLGLQLVSSLISVVNGLNKELQVTLRQIKAVKAKLGAKPTKKESAKVADLNDKALDLKKKCDTLDARMDHIFKSIFVHRYRDIFAEIRAACVARLGEWVVTYPIKFLNDRYLKYIGWTLSDRIPEVRLAALRGLIDLYANDDNYATLDIFTQRFKGRIVQCTLDEELSVALVAVELSSRLAVLGALNDDDMHQLNSLLSDSNVRIRFAAAEYLNNTLLQEVAANNDDQAQTHSLQLKELLNFVVKHTHQPKNPNYVVDALWAQAPALRAWRAMADLMVPDDAGQPAAEEVQDARERTVLAALINACVKKASGLAICPKVKTDPDAVVKSKEKAANQRKLSKCFAKRLPELLEQCKTEPEQLEELIELPQFFDFDVYHTERYEKPFKALLDQMHEIYLSNTREGVLRACAKTYRAMLTQQHAMRKEAEVAFGRLTDELADRYLQALPTLDPAEGPTELNEEAEFALRMALARIHQLYMVLDLARLDLYEPVRRLLDALLSGVFPSHYEKIMVLVVGVLGQHLLWSAAKFKPKTGDPTPITHQRDELLRQLARLLESGGAAATAPDVQDRAYLLLCDLALVFRPGLAHKGQRQLAAAPGALADILRNYVETVLDVPRARKKLPEDDADASGSESEEEEDDEEEGVDIVAKRKRSAKKTDDDEDEGKTNKKKVTKKKKTTTKKKNKKDNEDEEPRGKARIMLERMQRAAVKAKKAKEALRAQRAREAAEEEAEPEPAEDHKERRERELTPYESTVRKVRLIGGLAKLVAYNVIPRAENAPALLVHFVRHGREVKAALQHFLALLRAGDDAVRDDTSKLWVLILDALKKEFEKYLDEEDEWTKGVILEDFRELALRLALTFGVAQKRTRESLITLVHSGIIYAAEEAPARFEFLSGLPRFIASLGSRTTANYILKTFDEEMKDKYTFDAKDKACAPYYDFLARLRKAAGVAAPAVDELDEDELDKAATQQKKKTSAAKNKAGTKKTTAKKKNRMPQLELEKVPDRPRVSKTGRLAVDVPAEEEEEGEGEEEVMEEEEESLTRRGKNKATNQKAKKTATTKKITRRKGNEEEPEEHEEDAEGEHLSEEELVEEMEQD